MSRAQGLAVVVLLTVLVIVVFQNQVTWQSTVPVATMEEQPSADARVTMDTYEPISEEKLSVVSDYQYDTEVNNTMETTMETTIETTTVAPTTPILEEITEAPKTPIDKKLNVLFIIADDLRPEIGAYLDPLNRPWLFSGIKTPNLDALAERSLVLQRSYVQVARCNPSRVSLLTSRRPNTTHIINNDPWFRKVGHGKTITTLPQYFKLNNYTTVGFGKIFHLLGGVADGQDQGRSWTGSFYQPRGHYDTIVDSSWKAVSKRERANRPLRDQMTVAAALRSMEFEAKRTNITNKPFFMAVGLKKPHTPYIFPDEFLSLYPRESIRLAKNDYVPVNMTHRHWHNSRNTFSFNDTEGLRQNWEINSTLPKEMAIDLRRAYYASVSYADSLVGELLQQLDRLQLRDSTIVAFCSDHGYQLGEHGIWGKDTDLDLATNAPMMIAIPGKTDTRIDSHRLTEHVDLFPTLVDAAGLPPLPQCPLYSEETPVCTEGMSMMPLLSEPSTSIKWKNRVFSQYPSPDSGKPDFMGYSIRTKQFLYVEWICVKDVVHGVWGEPVNQELYNLEKDFSENHNVVGDSVYADTVTRLSGWLRAGWLAALPKG